MSVEDGRPISEAMAMLVGLLEDRIALVMESGERADVQIMGAITSLSERVTELERLMVRVVGVLENRA
ncbi:hypothetical protein [Streptosporangium sp. NPDC004631]